MALTKVKLIADGTIVQSNLHASHGITTADIGEGSNLYYTDARARAAVSVSGNALSYDSSTGVITSNYEESPTFTGNVGIGTSSPSQKLHVQNGYLLVDTNSAVGSGIWMPDINGNPSLRIVTDQATGSYTSIVNAWGNSSNTGVMLGTIRNDGIAFQVRSGVTLTNGFANDDGSTRFIVKGDGNVGIGTTSPSYKLEVNGGTALVGGGFYVSSDQNVQTNSVYTFRDGVYINNPNSSSAATTSNSVMSIGASTGNSVTTSLVTTGAIGVGTTSPAYKLDVTGSIALGGSGSGLRFVNGGATTTFIDENWGIQFNGDATHPVKIYNASLEIGYSSAGANRGTNNLLVSGSVGIGTTSPSYKLDVNGTTRATSSYHQNVNFTNTPTFQIGTDAFSSGFFVYDSTAAAYRMVVKSSTGYVGIGTTSPATYLDIAGDSIAIGTTYNFSINANNDGNWGFQVQRTSGQDDYNTRMKFYPVQSSQRKLGFWNAQTSSWMGYFDGSTNSNNNFIINGGSVGIGTTSPDTKLDVHGTTGTKNTTTLNSQTTSVYETSVYFVAGVSATSNHYITTTSVFPPMASGGTILVEVAASGYGSAGSNGFVFKYIAGGYGGHYNIPASYHPTEIIADTHTSNCNVAIYYPNSTTIGITVTNNQATYSIAGVMRVKITTTYS